MAVQAKLNWVMRQRLEVTDEEIVDAGDMADRQSHPLGELPPADINRPHRPKRHNLTRDEKLEIRFEHKLLPELTQGEIALKEGISKRQVQHALEGPVTPVKRKRYRTARHLLPNEIEAIYTFLNHSRINRYVPWGDYRFLIPELASYGAKFIKRSMKKLGFRRVKRGRTRLPLSEADMAYRAKLCAEWLEAYPTPEDWLLRGPVFSDETKATTQPYFMRYVTLHNSEDRHAFDLERDQSKYDWMFWGCFQGDTKGPCHVFDKGQGGVNSEKYCRLILPLVRQFMDSLPVRTVFQQDGATAHTARNTMMHLDQLEIYTIEWPPDSPDLNPIENVWAWMKDWLDIHYDLESLNAPALKAALLAAWEAVPRDFLRSLSLSMYDRVKECRDTGGKQLPN